MLTDTGENYSTGSCDLSSSGTEGGNLEDFLGVNCRLDINRGQEQCRTTNGKIGAGAGRTSDLEPDKNGESSEALGS